VFVGRVVKKYEREKENGMKNFTKHYVQNEYVGRVGDGYSFGYNKNDGYKNWI